MIRSALLASVMIAASGVARAGDHPIDRLLAARQLVAPRDPWNEAVRRIEARLGVAAESLPNMSTWVAVEGEDCAWLVLSRGRSAADRGMLSMVSTPVRLDQNASDQDERKSCLRCAAKARGAKAR